MLQLSRTIAQVLAIWTISSMGTAFAHSPLLSSSPIHKQTFKAAPTEIQLTFKAETKLIQILVKGADMQQLLRPTKVAENTTHTMILPALNSGNYVATWRALGKDGHLMKGKIGFSISP